MAWTWRLFYIASCHFPGTRDYVPPGSEYWEANAWVLLGSAWWVFLSTVLLILLLSTIHFLISLPFPVNFVSSTRGLWPLCFQFSSPAHCKGGEDKEGASKGHVVWRVSGGTLNHKREVKFSSQRCVQHSPTVADARINLLQNLTSENATSLLQLTDSTTPQKLSHMVVLSREGKSCSGC